MTTDTHTDPIHDTPVQPQQPSSWDQPSQESSVYPSQYSHTPEEPTNDSRRQPESPPVPVEHIQQTESVPPNPPTPTYDDIEEERGLPLILKILIGLIVVGFIGFLIFGVIVPLFSKNSSGKVTLTYWGLWENPTVMKSVLADFEKENPTIHVDYIQQDSKQYSERLLTRIANGTGPDVFRFHNSWLPMVQPALLALPDSVISKQDFTKNYFSVIQTDLVKNGAVYGIPLEIDTLAMFTNNQLFQAAGAKPPTNWTDFITISRNLTVKDESGKIKTAGAAMGTFDNITHAPDIISLLFVQNGADISKLNTTVQNASDSLSFYTSFAKDQGNVWDTTLEQSLTDFISGNLGIYFGYSYDVFTIKAINPTLQFTISPVPHLPGRDMTIASYWVEGVSNKSKHQKESLLLMKYLAQKSTAQKLYTEEAKTRLFGEPYARTDLADTLKDNPLVYPFVQQAKNARSSFFAGETNDSGLNAQMNAYLGNAVRAVLGNTSPETAVDTLAKGVAQVLQKYGISQ